MHSEITIVDWDKKPISAVVRMNGFRGHIISTRNPQNVEANHKNSFKHNLVDVDGVKYTAYNFRFQQNKRHFGGERPFKNYRASLTWLLKGGHIDDIKFGLLSHPQLEVILRNDIQNFLIDAVETDSSTDGEVYRPKALNVTALKEHKEKIGLAGYDFDFSSNLSFRHWYSCFVRLNFESETHIDQAMYRLRLVHSLISLACYSGDYLEFNSSNYNIGIIDSSGKEKRLLVIGGKAEPFIQIEKHDHTIPLLNSENLLMAIQWSHVCDSIYASAIRSLYESLRPGIRMEDSMSQIFSAMEACEFSREELSNFKGYKLQKQLAALFDRFEYDHSAKLKTHEKTIKFLYHFRQAVVHANPFIDESGNSLEFNSDVMEHFYSYRAVLVICILYKILNEANINIRIDITTPNYLVLNAISR